jgi:hypothetical protein
VGLDAGFANLKQLVGQQLTLSEEEKQEAVEGLDTLLNTLNASSATMEEVKAARSDVTSSFPWLEQPLKTLLSTPAALQVLGQIAARSF